MTTLQVPFLRGTTAQNNAYTGADGEISIDTQKRTLRIHDGVTAGGEELLRQTDLENFITGETPYIHRHSVASKFVVYRAHAAPGSLDNSPVWSLQKITITYGASVTSQITYANGTKAFTNKWSDRATYTYSPLP